MTSQAPRAGILGTDTTAGAWRAALTKFSGWTSVNRAAIVSALVLLAIWELAGWVANYPFLPPVSMVLLALVEVLVDGTIFAALATTLLALCVGLVIAIVLGITVGAGLGLSKTVRIALGPYIDALMTAPMTAFVPLFILLFGLGIETRIIVVVLFAFFPIVVNTQAGMTAAREDLLEMGRSFGCNWRQTFFKIRLPMSASHIRAGLRMGMVRGVEGNITGEVLIAAVGIGGLITKYGRAFSSDKLFAVVIVVVAMSFTAAWLTKLATRRLTAGSED